MTSIIFVLVLFSAIGSGLMAGLFFIFSNTAMKAFGILPPTHGIAAMQSINRVILNPIFFLGFIGTAVICALDIVFIIWNWGHPGAIYILLGALIYLLGCFLVTVVKNVPMNNSLDAADPDSEEAANLWNKYLVDWTAWNHVRTIACLLSTVFFIFGFRYL